MMQHMFQNGTHGTNRGLKGKGYDEIEVKLHPNDINMFHRFQGVNDSKMSQEGEVVPSFKKFDHVLRNPHIMRHIRHHAEQHRATGGMIHPSETNGMHGDTKLAYVGPHLHRLLNEFAGHKTHNPYDGLPQFYSLQSLFNGIGNFFDPMINRVIKPARDKYHSIMGRTPIGPRGRVSDLLKPQEPEWGDYQAAPQAGGWNMDQLFGGNPQASQPSPRQSLPLPPGHSPFPSARRQQSEGYGPSMGPSAPRPMHTLDSLFGPQMGAQQRPGSPLPMPPGHSPFPSNRRQQSEGYGPSMQPSMQPQASQQMHSMPQQQQQPEWGAYQAAPQPMPQRPRDPFQDLYQQQRNSMMPSR